MLYWVLLTPGVWRGVLGAVGVLMALQGVVWILQGVNILPGSFMTGDIRWAYRGSVVAAIGIGLFFLARRKRRGGELVTSDS